MASTLTNRSSASQREELAPVRTPEPPVQVHANRLRDIAAEVMRSHAGNARAAAIDLNVHEGHLSRLLKDGTIRLEQLEVLGPTFAARLGHALVEQFGPLSDPKDHARRLIHQIETALVELKSFVEVA
jgi:hypothetical protein